MARGRFASTGGDDYVHTGDDGFYDDYSAFAVNYSDYSDFYCGESDPNDPKKRVLYYTKVYVWPLLLFQGIVGNVLCAPALFSLGRNAWSTLLYLALLGLTDLFQLLTNCGNLWYEEVKGYSLAGEIVNSSDAVCRTYNFAFNFVRHFGPWLMVAAAVEMMIVTRWPKTAHEACTPERARYVVMLLTLILVCLDINYFWTHGIPRPGLGCRYTEEFSDNFRDWIWPTLDTGVRVSLPLLAMLGCVLVAGLTLVMRSPAQEEELRLYMSKYCLELPTMADFRGVVFILSVLFLFLLAYRAAMELNTFIESRKSIKTVDCDELAQFMLHNDILNTVENTLSSFFWGCKIYVYVGASQAFRGRLLQGFQRAARLGNSLVQRCGRLCGTHHEWSPVARENRHGAEGDGNDDDDELGLSRGGKKGGDGAGRGSRMGKYANGRRAGSVTRLAEGSVGEADKEREGESGAGVGGGVYDYPVTPDVDAPSHFRETLADVHSDQGMAGSLLQNNLDLDDEDAAWRNSGDRDPNGPSPNHDYGQWHRPPAALLLSHGDTPERNRQRENGAAAMVGTDRLNGPQHANLNETNLRQKPNNGHLQQAPQKHHAKPQNKRNALRNHEPHKAPSSSKELNNGQPAVHMNDLSSGPDTPLSNGTRHMAYGDHVV